MDILKAGTRSDVPIALRNAAHSDPTPTAAAKCPKPPAPLEKFRLLSQVKSLQWI